jgi:hypothetical protein
MVSACHPIVFDGGIMGTLKTLSHEGDTRISWDADNPDEVAVAREAFLRLIRRGYLAYTADGDEARGSQIHAFDPEAETVVLVPALQGG